MYDYNLIFIIDQSITSTVNITTSTSYILPQLSKGTLDINSKMRMPMSTFSNEVLVTTLYKQSQTNTVLSASSSIPYPDVTKSLLTNSIQKTLSTSSTLNATSVTYSTANFVITTSPCHPNNIDNDKGMYIHQINISIPEIAITFNYE